MTATTGSEILIAPPALEEPVTGMMAQLPVITGPEAERWLAGLTTVPEEFGQPEFSELCSSASLLGTANRLTPRKAQPFMLTLRDRCSTWGWTVNDYIGRATRGLAVKRHWGVEREFESGALIGGNFVLADTYADPATATLAGGVAVSPKDAMALLDESIGNSPAVFGRGLIFCTPFVGAQWKGAGILEYEVVDDDADVGERATILSPAGNYVIICGGFEGRGPDGLVPASHSAQWAYATDPMVVVASDPETYPGTLAEATDKALNNVVYRQQQWFAILWPAMHHAAVKVSTDTPASSGGGGSAEVVTNTTTGFAETSTVLAGNASVNGASHATNGYSRFRAFAASDQSGTLSIQQSADGGVTWDTTLSQAVVGGTAAVLESIVATPNVRAVYLNGATLQTAFRFRTMLVAI